MPGIARCLIYDVRPRPARLRVSRHLVTADPARVRSSVRRGAGIARCLIYDVAPSCQIARRPAIMVR
jgi:hypothetical protein